MDLNGIREAIRRQPFQPFTIRLVDGRSLPVSHPEYVAVGPRLALVVAEDNSWSVVEPLLIVSLDFDAPGPKPDGNGSGKHGKKRRS
jgi:hypothetical protein